MRLRLTNKKLLSATAGIVLFMLLMSGIASAHVTVSPNATTQGAYEVFTVRVPSEKKDVQTMIVKVRVPAGVEVSRTQPLPGWKTSLQKSADGRVEFVTWTAEQGQGLTAEEFTEFKLSGKVADDAKELSWKAYQTYSDNSVVEWIGAADADYPASVTTVAAGSGSAAGHDHGGSPAASEPAASAVPAVSEAPTATTEPAASMEPAANEAPEASPAPTVDEALGSSSEKSDLSLYLSIAALVLGVIAVIAAFARRGNTKR